MGYYWDYHGIIFPTLGKEFIWTSISVLQEQCLDRRIESRELLEKEINAWQEERNASKATIDWGFTVNTARDKLKRLYPEV